jgi:hypothetical protein
MKPKKSVKIQYKYKYNTYTIQYKYKYNTNTIHIQYKYNTYTIQIKYKYNTDTIQIQYKYNTIQYRYNTNTVQIQIQHDEDKMRFSYRITKARNTRTHNIQYCFSMATVVTRTRLNVTLNVHNPSCSRRCKLFIVFSNSRRDKLIFIYCK